MNSYPSGMTLRPLQSWPRDFTRTRRRSPFRTAWSDTLLLLDRELRALGTGNRNAPSVLQIALREQDFRHDGMPYANSVPDHPGVILNIEAASQGPLSFPCDAFDRWQDNLRAIALALEALRKVDRYGITPGNEQYTGWKAIESTPTVDASKLSGSYASTPATNSARHQPWKTCTAAHAAKPTQIATAATSLSGTASRTPPRC